MSDGQSGIEDLVILPGRERDGLMRLRQIGRKLADGDIFNEGDEDPLVELARELILAAAPLGAEPAPRNEEDDGFALRRLCVERALPPFAGGSSFHGIEIEKERRSSLAP